MQTTCLFIWLTPNPPCPCYYRLSKGLVISQVFVVNWEKSLLFPLDPDTPISLPSSCPLKIVSTFQCLGIVVQQLISLYLKNNLDPLFSHHKNTLKVWSTLPPNLLGRINIFKMFFSVTLSLHTEQLPSICS